MNATIMLFNAVFIFISGLCNYSETRIRGVNNIENNIKLNDITECTKTREIINVLNLVL